MLRVEVDELLHNVWTGDVLDELGVVEGAPLLDQLHHLSDSEGPRRSALMVGQSWDLREAVRTVRSGEGRC